MPLQNRVNPYGEICFSPHRGHLMGNRGCLHNPQQTIIKNYQLKRWLICVLHYHGVRRTVMSKGRYTELFFWDEATALSAGHRPCAECQRARYLQFKHFWQQANHLTGISTKDLDNFLHQERVSEQPIFMNIQQLPEGVFVGHESKPYLIFNKNLFEWSFNGYVSKKILSHTENFRLLTPPSIVKTIEAGFTPNIVFTTDTKPLKITADND